MQTRAELILRYLSQMDYGPEELFETLDSLSQAGSMTGAARDLGLAWHATVINRMRRLEQIARDLGDLGEDEEIYEATGSRQRPYRLTAAGERLLDQWKRTAPAE